jgi:hypothetical protein
MICRDGYYAGGSLSGSHSDGSFQNNGMLTMELNMNTRTLHYFVNGKLMSHHFTNIPPSVYFYVWNIFIFSIFLFYFLFLDWWSHWCNLWNSFIQTIRYTNSNSKFRKYTNGLEINDYKKNKQTKTQKILKILKNLQKWLLIKGNRRKIEKKIFRKFYTDPSIIKSILSKFNCLFINSRIETHFLSKSLQSL